MMLLTLSGILTAVAFGLTVWHLSTGKPNIAVPVLLLSILELLHLIPVR